MIEYIIGGVLAIIVIVYLLNKMPINHFKICEYCGRRNYLGTTNTGFERDHLRQYRCKKCGADLFPHTETGKEETVHIVKGNGWCRYYTYEGWREE